MLSHLYGPTLTSIRDYWKNHSFDYTFYYYHCFLTSGASLNCLFFTSDWTSKEISFVSQWSEMRDFQVVLVVKNSPASARDIRDVGSVPGLGRSPGGGHGSPLQHSCLETACMVRNENLFLRKFSTLSFSLCDMQLPFINVLFLDCGNTFWVRFWCIFYSYTYLIQSVWNRLVIFL